MKLADISKLDIKNPFKQRYADFIGGRFVAPVKGQHFENINSFIGKTSLTAWKPMGTAGDRRNLRQRQAHRRNHGGRHSAGQR